MRTEIFQSQDDREDDDSGEKPEDTVETVDKTEKEFLEGKDDSTSGDKDTKKITRIEAGPKPHKDDSYQRLAKDPEYTSMMLRYLFISVEIKLNINSCVAYS